MEDTSSVEIQFLGSGDAFGSGGRFQACILLKTAGSRTLLDCGASSLVAMKRAEMPPSKPASRVAESAFVVAPDGPPSRSSPSSFSSATKRAARSF